MIVSGGARTGRRRHIGRPVRRSGHRCIAIIREEISYHSGGFRGRVTPELGAESAREFAVRAERAGAVAGATVKLEEVSQAWLVVRLERHRATCPRDSRRYLVASLTRRHDTPSPACGRTTERCSFALQPLVELATVVDVERSEKLASIQIERLLDPPMCERSTKGDGVTPEPIRRDANFVTAASDKRVRAELLSQKMERLIQRVAGPGTVDLRPEHRQQLISPMHTAMICRCKIHEQRESLRLHEHVVERSTSVVMQVERSKGP